MLIRRIDGLYIGRQSYIDTLFQTNSEPDFKLPCGIINRWRIRVYSSYHNMTVHKDVRNSMDSSQVEWQLFVLVFRPQGPIASSCGFCPASTIYERQKSCPSLCRLSVTCIKCWPLLYDNGEGNSNLTRPPINMRTGI